MTNLETACTQLAERYKAKAAEGLVDVKYFVRNVEEATIEAVCAEALRLEEAIERGNVFPLNFDDLPAR